MQQESQISTFAVFLAENIAKFQSLRSSDSVTLGRRARKLALLKEFWALPSAEQQRLSQIASDPSNKDMILTALSTINGEKDENDTPFGVGLVLRTDYTNDDAWSKFCETLRNAEKESIEEDEGDVDMAENDVDADANDGDGDSDSESEDEDETEQSLFIIKSDPSMNLTGLSNIAALRLFNDVDIVSAPKRPDDAPIPKVKTFHPLMNRDGLVETYTGNLLWIYDTKSNTDCSVRVVSQGCTYGTATGDSWRARAPFLPGLQVNLFGGGMRITFTGLDGWDQDERKKNLEEGNVV